VGTLPLAVTMFKLYDLFEDKDQRAKEPVKTAPFSLIGAGFDTSGEANIGLLLL